MLYNIHRDTKIAPKGIDWQDVFPEWKQPIRLQTEEEMFQTMMMLTKVEPPLPS